MCITQRGSGTKSLTGVNGGVEIARYTGLMLGTFLKGLVEEQGSLLTGTAVRLAEATVSPLSGSVALRGLVVDNPKGFATRQVLTVDLVTARLDLWSLRHDLLRVSAVEVSGVGLVLETGTGGRNLARLRRTLAHSKDRKEKGQQRLLIERLSVSGGRLDLCACGRMKILALPPVELRSLGDARGATFAEVGSAFFLALADQGERATRKVATIPTPLRSTPRRPSPPTT